VFVLLAIKPPAAPLPPNQSRIQQIVEQTLKLHMVLTEPSRSEARFTSKEPLVIERLNRDCQPAAGIDSSAENSM
jgi:hypothetical protein